MKKKIQHLIAVLCLGIVILSGCDDNQSLIGIGPEGDRITVYSDTFHIQATTIRRDSLFAKSTTGLVGEYYDPLYGRLKADYLCQFYCQDDYQFQKTPYENKIDSIYVALYYMATGDPNTPFQFKIIPVTKPLDKAYYTNANPADYCDLNTLWASQVFTAANGTIIDSIQVSANEYMYYRRIEILLPREIGQNIYEETVNNPSSFKTQQAFNNYFPGIYVTTGYGSGCLFDIQRTDIFIDYKYAEKDTAGLDSIVYYNERFITTKEVIQLNRFENTDTDQLLADNDDYTFIKTPAGIYTRLVLPATQIKPVIEGRIINSMIFKIKYMPQEDWLYALGPPSHLLLLPEDSLISFFHNRMVENSVTSFISFNESSGSAAATTSGYNADTRTYSFGNIATLLAYHLGVSPDDDLRLLVVPVSRATSGGGDNPYYSTEITNFLTPSGVKLRKDNDLMKISISTSIYHYK